jgi:hypothetical protein
MAELGWRVNIFPANFLKSVPPSTQINSIKTIPRRAEQILTLKIPGKTLQDFAATDGIRIVILGHEGDQVSSAESHGLVAARPHKGCSQEQLIMRSRSP